MNNKIKAFRYIQILNLIFSLFDVIIIFLLGKFFGFESSAFTPGSSTVRHPLITSYIEGFLLNWNKYIIIFLVILLFTNLLTLSFYKPLKEYFDEKDEKMKKMKIEDNNSINETNL